jgi:predicted flap endonuclease-1-like 5' DNA nuclease
MTTVADSNLILLIVALVIGMLVGWWMFRRTRVSDDRPEEIAPTAPAPKVAAPDRPVPRSLDTREGNGLADQGAAATSDVAGEMLGVQVHSELPGASGPPDNLAMMKGVGPKFVARLNENGITRFDQIARLSANEATILDDKMGPFKGRIARDRVIEQAGYLARGDREGFEGTFGNLGGNPGGA